jgi:hypothetical protein
VTIVYLHNKYKNTIVFYHEKRNYPIVFDEIQTCPEAIQSLRYFKEKIPELHVICAGSLLDHTLNEMKLPMPVGRVEFLYMYPMSFKEFLKAINQEKLVTYIPF